MPTFVLPLNRVSPLLSTITRCVEDFDSMAPLSRNDGIVAWPDLEPDTGNIEERIEEFFSIRSGARYPIKVLRGNVIRIGFYAPILSL